ncbi:FTR1 family iron permease [Pseudothauera rhizosphaerae]|nr:FTR1 family protein [Pseudothauera rhizosphaerae]
MLSLCRRFLLAALCALLAPAAQAEAPDYAVVTATILSRAEAALDAYDPASPEATASEFSTLYFGVFESSGMELALIQADRSLLLAIELRFGQMVRQAMKGEPRERLRATWAELRPMLEQGAALLGTSPALDGAFDIAVQAALIVLREGAEAMLVVAALAVYLRRTGQYGHFTALWGGVGGALAASLATAWAFSTLLASAGAARETIEGACLLAAATLLLWVSLWIYSHREIAHWQDYLKTRLDQAATADSGWTVGSTAFLAVYREGAETVLFLQAVGGSSAPAGAVAGGALAAALLLGAAWLVLRSTAMRLPLKPFFTATAVVLFVLAISFVGKGILELQVAGLADISRIEGAPEWPLLGIFPTAQTLGAQGAALLLCALALLWPQLHGGGRKPAA